MDDKYKVKIMKGHKKFSVKYWPKEKAEEMAEKGLVRIIDRPDVETTSMEQDDITTPEDQTCKGTTSDGSPCKRQPDEGKYCWQHTPEQGDK